MEKRVGNKRLEGEYGQDKNDLSAKGASSKITRRQMLMWSLWGGVWSELSLVSGMFKVVLWEMCRTQKHETRKR